jgi:hypothetical protein
MIIVIFGTRHGQFPVVLSINKCLSYRSPSGPPCLASRRDRKCN